MAEVFSPPSGKSDQVPKGARLEPSGYLTILEVPPTPAQPQRRPPEPPVGSSSPGPAIPSGVAPGIRLFVRLRPRPSPSESLPQILVAPPQQISRVILRDGCFRLAEPGEPLVVFTLATRLVIDREGYLAFTASPDNGPLPARVGEQVWWEGERRELQDPQDLALIHARCGAGAVQVLGLVQSVAVGQATADFQATKRIADMYGLPWKEAFAAARKCRERMSRAPNGMQVVTVQNACGLTPPPPVADGKACPPGTSLSSGMCRTPEGYVRPIPDWLRT
jgi:hypothetical protein